MGLAPMLDRLARTLSGGMLRRLEIATALLNRPEVLFLDEPTVGLDPTARRLVWERLDALREQAGTTILVTTHLMEEAERHCDRLGVIDRGRLVEQGEPGELLERHGADSLEEVFTAVTGRLAGRRRRRGRGREAQPMSAPSAASPAVSAERPPGGPSVLDAGPLARMAEGTAGDGQAELRKLRHDHLDIVTRSVQPLLWLFIFGTALQQHPRAGQPAQVDYRAYLAPGVMAQAAMFIAIFFGLVGDLGTRRGPAAAAAGDAAVAHRDRARQGRRRVRAGARAGAAAAGRCSPSTGIGVRWTRRRSRSARSRC